MAVYLELCPHMQSGVIALSSGFMVYSHSVHPEYDEICAAIARSHSTVVLLPSVDREVCIAETVRRQLGRPLCRRDAAEEEVVIRERFPRYMALPATKVETMHPPEEVAATIHAQLMANAPDALSAMR